MNITGLIDRNGEYTHHSFTVIFSFSLLRIDLKSHKSTTANTVILYPAVLSSLYEECHKEGQYVWQKYEMCHKPTFFCPCLKSEPTGLHPEATMQKSTSAQMLIEPDEPFR